LLVRDGFGRVHALRNSCPHLPHALVGERRGRFADGIECTVHGLRFAEDGRRTAGTGGGDLAALDLRAADGFYWVGAVALPQGVERQPAGWGDRFRVEGRVLQELPDLELRANWKLIAEQWLEALGPQIEIGSSAIDAAIDPIGSGSGWSAAKYRRLAGSSAAERWAVRFLAPNQLVERRPDGLSVLQLIPSGPEQCRVRRIHLARDPLAPQDGRSNALRYLAGRLVPWCRRGTLTIAESAQRGLSEFGYRASASAPPAAVAWFRRVLAARIPMIAAERPPNESRQMHYNRHPA
jgi:phenylpropionate dioxygenase-like ring-hydroxylating dioxygenase large terminal subunit